MYADVSVTRPGGPPFAEPSQVSCETALPTIAAPSVSSVSATTLPQHVAFNEPDAEVPDRAKGPTVVLQLDAHDGPELLEPVAVPVKV